MSITKEDMIAIRKQYLYDLRDIVQSLGDQKTRELIADKVRNAEADEIALRDPGAAETYRNLVPEW